MGRIVAIVEGNDQGDGLPPESPTAAEGRLGRIEYPKTESTGSRGAATSANKGDWCEHEVFYMETSDWMPIKASC